MPEVTDRTAGRAPVRRKDDVRSNSEDTRQGDCNQWLFYGNSCSFKHEMSKKGGQCTKPSCDYWHRVECAKHKTNEGCKFGEKCAFPHSENGEAPNKMTKKRDSKADKATIALVRSIQKLGCVSRRIESLPEPEVGPTNARLSILKKNGIDQVRGRGTRLCDHSKERRRRR